MLLLSLSFSKLGSLLAVASLMFAPSHANPATSCCLKLAAQLSSKVAYPDTPSYNASVSSYWAQQEQSMAPSCVILPTSASDVSSAIQLLVPAGCKFAVRNGGHGSVTGISNINGGVTIDLRGIDTIALNADNSLATVGGGQIWYNVYETLGQAGVTVPGGRDSNIGVAGSTLGGALGYIGPSVGFGCDSVVQYEIVLANGSIVTANKSKNSDLWMALKGGGSNFGIVTQLVYSTTKIGQIWAGNSAYVASSVQSEISAFYNFTANPKYDPKADIMMTYHYTADGGIQIANGYAYAEPVANPPAFNEFYPIPGQLGNLTSITNIADFSITQEATSPDGFQQITFAMSFENSVKQLQDMWTIYNASLASIANVAGISWSLTFEPITASLINGANARGGDILGIVAPCNGLVQTLASVTFSSASDYPKMDALTEQLLSDVIAAAKKNHVYYPYIDLNHAKASQNVFAGYGAANHAYLKRVASKYDPSGVFQTLMPGGFKL